ncbi:MAG: lipid A biosynthesis protein [Thermoanaerobaculia bacterium]|nr:lipid A biosynthesis protein [Thermoanaerobaculia bacterium]
MGVANGTDPREVGLSWAWLVFGFAAQALFMGRMLVQWIASEKAKSSVVPVAFWWLSVIGGLMLLAYFLRRGDPVGVLGQLFGVVVYARNLIFIHRGGAGLRSSPKS